MAVFAFVYCAGIPRNDGDDENCEFLILLITALVLMLGRVSDP